MNREEFENLDRSEAPRLVGVGDLLNRSDRTLLYGYDVDRNSWHVYLLGGEIHLLVRGQRNTIFFDAEPSWVAEQLVPNKRVYPESTDKQFAELLFDRGAPMTFSRWSDERAERVRDLAFHGPVL